MIDTNFVLTIVVAAALYDIPKMLIVWGWKQLRDYREQRALFKALSGYEPGPGETISYYNNRTGETLHL